MSINPFFNIFFFENFRESSINLKKKLEIIAETRKNPNKLNAITDNYLFWPQFQYYKLAHRSRRRL